MINIVAIDDCEDMVELLQNILDEQKDFNVTYFTEPVKAMDYILLNINSIDLVLTDRKMPKLSGCDLVRLIQVAGYTG